MPSLRGYFAAAKFQITETLVAPDAGGLLCICGGHCQYRCTKEQADASNPGDPEVSTTWQSVIAPPAEIETCTCVIPWSTARLVSLGRFGNSCPLVAAIRVEEKDVADTASESAPPGAASADLADTDDAASVLAPGLGELPTSVTGVLCVVERIAAWESVMADFAGATECCPPTACSSPRAGRARSGAGADKIGFTAAGT